MDAVHRVLISSILNQENRSITAESLHVTDLFLRSADGELLSLHS